MVSSISPPATHFQVPHVCAAAIKGTSADRPLVEHCENASQSPLPVACSKIKPDNLPDMLSFSKYRPASHFIAPHSWMNDPCGVVYVEETKEYILCYQWNPGTSDGGNSAWGMAHSKDLVTWEDCPPAIRNGTDTQYDSKGVFSGSIISRLVNRERLLYLFYTSVSRLPIHWSSPYLRGCESQSVAVSKDFGKSWRGYEHKPLLSNPPLKSQTTGWRDPHVAPWHGLSAIRGVSKDTQYLMLSSGDRAHGPQLLLYESCDLLEWQELGVILRGAADSPISSDSDLIFGRNFECASFFTTGSTDYIIAGMELHPSTTQRHSSRYTIWMSGVLVLEQGKPRFEITAHGLLDSGIFYAPHVFRGANDQILLSGWSDEDDNSLTKAQAWAGCLTNPRELFEVRVPDLDVQARDLHLWHHDIETSTMTTLGVRPAIETSTLRTGSVIHNIKTLSSIRSKNFEVEACFSKLSGSEILVFNVRQAPNDREVTKIVISLPENMITIDRSKSSLNNGNSSPDAGSFQLLKKTTLSSLEDLKVRIWIDNSIVEVYANDRFALTSRIYPSLETADGVSYNFTDGKNQLDENKVTLRCWEGLRSSWPERVQPQLWDKSEGKVPHIKTKELSIQPIYV